MTITMCKELNNITMNMTAEKTAGGRCEEWRLTFDQPVDQIPDDIIKTAAEAVSWLWMPSIHRESSTTVIYSGYID